MVALGIEHAAEKGGRGAHLLLDVEPFEVEYDGNAMLPDAPGDAGELRFGARGVDHHMSEPVGERHEIALGIDHALLHPWSRLLQQPAQQV